MNLKLVTQKQDYDCLVEKYRRIQEIVIERLEYELARSDIKIMQLPWRIKTWASIEEKWTRKADKYLNVAEITDMLGFRIICYFSSQVDEAAEIIRDIFDVDKDMSCDKRTMISPNSFGYISLHIICSLKNDGSVPEELAGLKFEIQLKSILQHAWAEIEHDLGYKSAIEIPRDMRREFARIAGLLEIADEAFDKIKSKLRNYQEEVVDRLRTDTADHMTLDIHTLNAFMKYSPAVEKLYSEMIGITGGSILVTGAESYLPVCSIFGINTLGDLYDLVANERDHALMLVERALDYSDLEEITTNSALFYLFRSRLIWGDYTEREINDIYFRMSGSMEKAYRDTAMIMKNRREFGI